MTTLRFLKVTDKIDNPFELMPCIDLFTRRKDIESKLTSEFLNIAGMIEYDHLRNANNLIYFETEKKIFDHPHRAEQALIIWLLWLEMLIKDAWLIKDHAITCEVAYCRIQTETETDWSNNYLTTSSSLSSGAQYQEVTFSKKEIVKWEKISNISQSFLASHNSGPLESFISKQYSRIGRAYAFIDAARKELHPALKISHYCSALESLFSTDTTELAHKLSERVAIFLKEDGMNPLETYDKIKEFYTIRSKVTHGDSVKGKREKDIPDLSVLCDSYLRKIMNKILKDKTLTELFESNQETFEAHFKQRILA